MTSSKRVLAGMLFCATMLLSFPSFSSTDETESALYPLLKVTGEKIPHASSCYGVYHSIKEATIGDMLVSQLSNLDGGKNVISGKCSRLSLCYLDINHDAGDDISSFHVQYTVHNGSLDIHTLKCEMTP